MSAFLNELSHGQGLPGALHQSMLHRIQVSQGRLRHNLPSGDDRERVRSMLAAWLLVHTGVVHEALEVLECTAHADADDLSPDVHDVAAYSSLAASLTKSYDITHESAMKLQLALNGAAAGGRQDADLAAVARAAVDASSMRSRMDAVWRAAHGLARKLDSLGHFDSGRAQYTGKGVDLLIKSSPQAAVRLDLSVDKVTSLCSSLSEEALQYLQSRADHSQVKRCLDAHQQRAFSRASGFRVAASVLHLYAAQPHVVSLLLELVQQARTKNGKALPPPTEPLQPHYLSGLECGGIYATAHVRAAFAAMLEGITALIEPTTTPDELAAPATPAPLGRGTNAPAAASESSPGGSNGGAARASAERGCRLLALQALHIPVAAEDTALISSSPLMRRLRLNGRGTGTEAQYCQLLWNLLASMCLQSSAASAPAGQAEARTGGPGPLMPMRQSSLTAAPWTALLDQLCDSLAVRLQGGAIRSTRGGDGSTDGASSDSALDPLNPPHMSGEAAMARLEAEAKAEMAVRVANAETADAAPRTPSLRDGGEAEGASAEGEARERVESERAVISMLGLLVYACAENSELVQALTSPQWLRVLLAVWHHASPRCTRLSMRLLAKVLPLTTPDEARVPRPASLLNLATSFHRDHEDEGEPLIPFLFAIVGTELGSPAHHLPFGKHTWRPATAWQPIVDGTLSLLRRLLLAESWRPALLRAIEEGIQATEATLALPPEAPLDHRACAALTAYSILGGHTWCVSPGARVSVLSADEGRANSTGGTVLHGGCGAEEFSVVLEGAAKGWRTPQVVPAERVVARPQVALSPSLLRKHLGTGSLGGRGRSADRAPLATVLDGYRAVLANDAARTPLGALLRSRGLSSLQWLTEDRTSLRMLLSAGLFPLLVANAVRPTPLESSYTRDAIHRQLIVIDVAVRELQTCRRPPADLHTVAPSELHGLIRARHGPTASVTDILARDAGSPRVQAAANSLLDGRSHLAAVESCAVLLAEAGGLAMEQAESEDGGNCEAVAAAGAQAGAPSREHATSAPEHSGAAGSAAAGSAAAGSDAAGSDAPAPSSYEVEAPALKHSPSWEAAFGVKAVLAEMGMDESFTTGACRAAVKATNRGRPAGTDAVDANAAVAWLFERLGSDSIPGMYEEPPTREEMLAERSYSELSVELPDGSSLQAADASLATDETGEWFAVPDGRPRTAGRALPSSRAAAPAPPPPPPAQAAQFQTLQVTRPADGRTVIPGQQIIVADPHGNQYRTTVPAGIQPGASFHVRVPAPQASRAAASAAAAPVGQRSSEDDGADSEATIGEFLPLTVDAQRDAFRGTSPLDGLDSGALEAAKRAAAEAQRAGQAGSPFVEDASSSARAESAAAGSPSNRADWTFRHPFGRLEVVRGAPMFVEESNGCLTMGLVCDVEWRESRVYSTVGQEARGTNVWWRIQKVTMLVRDPQSDALRLRTVDEFAPNSGFGQVGRAKRLLHLPEAIAAAAFAPAHEGPKDATMLVELRARAHAALGALAMRRAVMNAIPLMIVGSNDSASAGAASPGTPSAGGGGGSGGFGEDCGGGLGAGGSGAADASVAVGSLGSLVTLMDDPRQLHQLLKLAHAAGGARFEALLDGLRMLLAALPPRMTVLPELLCTDALEHISRSIKMVGEASSRHPLGATVDERVVRRIHVSGAASIRLEMDSRSELPSVPIKNGQPPPKGADATLYLSMTPRIEQAVRTMRSAARDGGWLPAVVPGDTAFLIYVPRTNRTAAGASNPAAKWGWRVRAVAESWKALSEEETLKAPLPLGWPMLHLLFESAPFALTAPHVFHSLIDILKHPSNDGKEAAAALLLRLLTYPTEKLREMAMDGREMWHLSKLLPLHGAVAWYQKNLDASKLLPRHAQCVQRASRNASCCCPPWRRGPAAP